MARGTFTGQEPTKTDPTPQRSVFRCKAENCPMAGTVDDFCGYHYRENPADWGRITRAIIDWEVVARTINRARRVMTDPAKCVDPKAQEEEKRDAWVQMQPALAGSGWKQRVAPKENENLGDWGRRLEVFLGARLKEVLQGGGLVVDETKPTPFVEQARKELRGHTTGNAGDFV